MQVICGKKTNLKTKPQNNTAVSHSRNVVHFEVRRVAFETARKSVRVHKAASAVHPAGLEEEWRLRHSPRATFLTEWLGSDACTYKGQKGI